MARMGLTIAGFIVVILSLAICKKSMIDDTSNRPIAELVYLYHYCRSIFLVNNGQLLSSLMLECGATSTR
jgi:hypothetical protein